MPVYEYKCNSCGAREEISKPLSRLNEGERCLKCGLPLERQFPSLIGGIIFKGEGFHKNDYKVKTDGK